MQREFSAAPADARFRVAAALLVCALLGACARPQAPPQTPPAAAAATEQPAIAEASQPDVQPAIAKQPVAEPAPQRERLILFTPRGPLIVHVEIAIDGKPQPSAVEHVLDMATQAAGAGATALPSWAELVANPRFATGFFGNAPLADPAARERAISAFDSNRDGRVDRAELAALLAQDSARGRGFSVEKVDDYGGAEDPDATVFALLDEDQDGRLSQVEMAAAAVRLRSRDANADDVVTAADFRPQQTGMAAMRRRPREPRPDRGFELRKLALDSIFYALCDGYDTGGGLDAEGFALVPSLFAQLDVDHSGAVDQREAAAILDARPDLVFRVDFGSAAGSRAKVALQAMSDDLAAAGARVATVAGGLTLELPGCQIDVSAVDLAAPTDRVAAAAAQFAALDTDQNDLLGGDELAALGPVSSLIVQALDANGDGQLSLEEMKAALASQPSYRDVQVQARLDQPLDRLLSWLDATSDGRLTARELLGARDRLAALDANGDGAVSAGEVPERLSCAILRGAPAGGAMPAGAPAPRREANGRAPRWLAAMDGNADGEVSRREFLGTAEQFRQIDTNGDGFLDQSEAQNVSAGPAPESPAAPRAD